MNASVSFFRAKMAPAALATAIGLAFAMSAPGQAQYRYPDSASSSGHSARISPVRAGGGHEYGEPGQTMQPGSFGNPSMHPGEACPPGSPCSPTDHGARSPDSGSGASSGYGSGHYAYGTAPREAGSAQPHEADYGTGISPARSGFGRQRLTQNPGSNPMKQQGLPSFGLTSQTGAPGISNPGSPGAPGTGSHAGNPGGTPKVTFTGSRQTVTSVNGQQVGGVPDFNKANEYGHLKGSQSQVGLGTFGRASRGGAPQTTNGMDPYKVDNGAAGAAEGDHTNPNFQKGQSKKGGVAVYDGPGHTAVSWGSTEWNGSTQSGHPDNGIDRNGTEWKDGVVWDGTDENGTKWRNGVASGGTPPTQDELNRRKGKLGGTPKDDIDFNGADPVITSRDIRKPQGDQGGGPGDTGPAAGGGNPVNPVTGTIMGPSGQDNVRKPKEKGMLKADYNGARGAIDPKQSGGG